MLWTLYAINVMGIYFTLGYNHVTTQWRFQKELFGLKIIYLVILYKESEIIRPKSLIFRTWIPWEIFLISSRIVLPAKELATLDSTRKLWKIMDIDQKLVYNNLYMIYFLNIFYFNIKEEKIQKKIIYKSST